jgi:hypothetical protein
MGKHSWRPPLKLRLNPFPLTPITESRLNSVSATSSPSQVVGQFKLESPEPTVKSSTKDVQSKTGYETGTPKPPVSDSVFYTPVAVEKPSNGELSSSAGQSAQNSDRSDKEDSAFMDKSGAVNISAINKILSSASISTKPEDLAAMILKMSYVPKTQKKYEDSDPWLTKTVDPIPKIAKQKDNTGMRPSLGMSDKPPIPSKIPALDKTVRPSRASFPRFGENDELVLKFNSDESAKKPARLSSASAEKNVGKNLKEMTSEKNSPSTPRPPLGVDQIAPTKVSKDAQQNTAVSDEKFKSTSSEIGMVGTPKNASSPARGLPKAKIEMRKDSPYKGSNVRMLKLKPPSAQRPQDVLSSDDEGSGPQPRPPRKASSRKKGQKERKEDGKNSKLSNGSNGGASPSLEGRAALVSNDHDEVRQNVADDQDVIKDKLEKQKTSQIPKRTRSESPPKPVEKLKTAGPTRIPRPVSSSRSRSRSADGDEKKKKSPGATLGAGSDRKGERKSRRDVGVCRMEPVEEASSPQWERKIPGAQDGDFETGLAIPSSPPVGWNTPRPSSVFSRPSSMQSNEESPPSKQALNYSKSSSAGVISPSIQSPNKYNNYTASSELTSGFHSQATDFMQTYNQTHVTRNSEPPGSGQTMNKTPSMHQLTPHYDVTPNDDATYRPRLSSTPMYGAPQTSPPVQDMPSNIISTPANRLMYGSDSLETTQNSPSVASPIVSSPTALRFENSLQGGEELVQGRSVVHKAHNSYQPPSSSSNSRTDTQHFVPHSALSQPSYTGTGTFSHTRPFSQSELYNTVTTYVHGPSNISTFTSQTGSRPNTVTSHSATSNEHLQTLPPHHGLDVLNGRDQDRFLRTAPQFGVCDYPGRRREEPTTSNATLPRGFRGGE